MTRTASTIVLFVCLYALSACSTGEAEVYVFDRPDARPQNPVPSDASQPPVDAAVAPRDSSAAAPDLGSTADVGGADAAPSGCAPGVAGCTCVERPAAEGSCVHSFGGVYANRGCSGSFQCCDGTWYNSTSYCGACACTDTTGTEGCIPPGEEVTFCFPEFDGTSEPIPAEIRNQMMGSSWHADLNCPSLDSLVLLRMPYFDFDGEVQRGQMIVAADVGGQVLQIFRTLYEVQFPIERMELVDVYGGDDDASMAANNTSAFNCRRVTGGSSLSSHSFGTAIDLNPVQNPYVRDGTVLPEAGRAYLDRSDVRPGMVVRPGVVVAAFEEAGWSWGGDFNSLKDYQHFSQDGR